MRTIKFRGWNKRSHIMVDNIKLMAYNGTASLNDAFDKDMIVLPLQWTGLVDINGKDIYEGDIVTHKNGFGEILTGQVKYGKQGSWFVTEGSQNKGGIIKLFNDLEVVGNVYESPELLKVVL